MCQIEVHPSIVVFPCDLVERCDILCIVQRFHAAGFRGCGRLACSKCHVEVSHLDVAWNELTEQERLPRTRQTEAECRRQAAIQGQAKGAAGSIAYIKAELAHLQADCAHAHLEVMQAPVQTLCAALPRSREMMLTVHT